MLQENQKIIEAYEKRKSIEPGLGQGASLHYSRLISQEREYFYELFIREKFKDLSNLNFIEVGAGIGTNIATFERIGISRKNIHANELIPDRFISLRENYPDIGLHEGDAIELKLPDNHFDIVFQSTVFTSILDTSVKQLLAAKMWAVTKPGGIILWYDFIYDNPKNKDVKGVPKSEIRKLFPGTKNIHFQKVTLAPPIGRRFVKLYKILNLFPFLRTHVIAVIEK